MIEPGKTPKSARTREKLLKTSLALMEQKGYQNTTVRDICAKANVSIGTFYSYFPSKNDLFFDIYKKADDYFTDYVAVQISGDGVPEKIVDFFRYYAELNINTGIDLLRILFNPDNSWFAQKRPMQQVLTALIEEGISSGELKCPDGPQSLVEMLFILARGCCYNWCILDGEYDLTAELTGYIETVLLSLIHI